MLKRAGAIALLAFGMLAILPGPSGWAQGYGYGYDDRPPPPPPDDGYRRPPPPDDDYGYRRRPPPPPRFSDDDDDRPLLCRTPEGSCRGRGPQFYRARCFCDFGDGPVRGRLR